nr:hypothetical protein B0A51_00218 [Rachicladosporium sp. CCFEE 5018]
MTCEVLNDCLIRLLNAGQITIDLDIVAVAKALRTVYDAQQDTIEFIVKLINVGEGTSDPLIRAIVEETRVAYFANEEHLDSRSSRSSSVAARDEKEGNNLACAGYGDLESRSATKEANQELVEARAEITRLREELEESRMNEEGSLHELQLRERQIEAAAKLAGLERGTLARNIVLMRELVRTLEREVADMKREAKDAAIRHQKREDEWHTMYHVSRAEVSTLKRKVLHFLGESDGATLQTDEVYSLRCRLKVVAEEVFDLTNANRRLQVQLESAISKEGQEKPILAELLADYGIAHAEAANGEYDAAFSTASHDDHDMQNDQVFASTQLLGDAGSNGSFNHSSNHTNTSKNTATGLGNRTFLPLRSLKSSSSEEKTNMAGSNLHKHRLKKARTADQEV